MYSEWRGIKNIEYNVWCMSSSGLKEQNLMKTQNYNRSTKHQNSTKTAIAYTRC